mgnify:FL=1
MGSGQIIENPLEIAGDVARVILEESYRKGVKDVLLFGSAIRGEEPKDLDLLALHNLYELNKFGMFTKYNEKTHRVEPDLDKNIEDQRFMAMHILEAMGSKNIDDPRDVKQFLYDHFHSNKFDLGLIRSDNVFSGNVQFRCSQYGLGLIDVEIKSGSAYSEVLEKVFDEVDKAVAKDLVLTKVAALMEARGLGLEENLDLHAMNNGLLVPKGVRDRTLAIKQCRDPTFWHSILSEGRLYNLDSGKFEVPVGDKYPQALDLFKQ